MVSEKNQGNSWVYPLTLTYFSIGAASLLVPIYALTLNAGPFIVGSLATTSGLAQVPGAIIWGKIADKVEHRRNVIIFGLLGIGTCLLAFTLFGSLTFLLILTGVLWFLISAFGPVLTLIAVDGVPEKLWEDRIATLNTYQQYGWVGGLAVGTLWITLYNNYVGILSPEISFFIFCSALIFVSIPLAEKSFPYVIKTKEKRFLHSKQSFERIFSDAGRMVKSVPFLPNRMYWGLTTLITGKTMKRFSKNLKSYLIAALMFYLAAGIFFGPAPAYLDFLGYTSGMIFLLFLLSNMTSGIFFKKVSEMISEKDPVSVQRKALYARVVIFPMIALIGVLFSDQSIFGYGLIAFLFILMGLTWAFIGLTATSLVTRLAPNKFRGEALGIHVAVGGIGGGIGSLIGGTIAEATNYLFAFSSAGLLFFVSIMLINKLRMFEERRK